MQSAQKVNNSNNSVLSDQTLMDDDNKNQIEQFKLKKVVNQQPVTETTIKVKESVEKKKEQFSSPMLMEEEDDDDEDEDYEIKERKSPLNK